MQNEKKSNYTVERKFWAFKLMNFVGRENEKLVNHVVLALYWSTSEAEIDKILGKAEASIVTKMAS